MNVRIQLQGMELESHIGSALGTKEVDATRKNLGWPYEPFHVPEDVKKYGWGVRDICVSLLPQY